jgi:fumarylacetoacetase
MSDATVDPDLRSWLPVDPRSDFPVQNLPFGIFRRGQDQPGVGVAISDQIISMAALERAGVFGHLDLPSGVFGEPTLNTFLSLGSRTWSGVRAAVSELLSGSPPSQPQPESFLVPMAEASMQLPTEIGDYVDFYSSIEHATNLGKLFRPDDPPLLPNWRRMPIGYHGRSSSVVVSGTPIIRPSGQRKPPDGEPVFGPSARLDIELEVGFITGAGNPLGERITVDRAEEHIFGLVLVNDWSARDIQAWEYRPLGPFLGKSFATSISPWVVPLQALAPYRKPAAAQDPEPLAYLNDHPHLGIDLSLSVALNGAVISTTNFGEVYWTMAQQLAHVTANGANVRAGDLYASGTISGPDPASRGSLLELSWNGTTPVPISDTETRAFLEDGDEVVLRGWCGGNSGPRLGFGECRGVILPATT